jgi:hypothetical protein
MKLRERNLPKVLIDSGGQDLAEYVVMLAVILLIVIGTMKLIGSRRASHHRASMPTPSSRAR